MPFSGLIVKEGAYKTSMFKDNDLNQIPSGFFVVRQSCFSFDHNDLKIKAGTIGMEGSGVIEHIPKGYSYRGFKVGDKVCYYLKKPLASYETVIVHESGLMKIPQEVSMQLAACARKFLTAHYLLQKIFVLKKDTWIAITGASGALGTIMTAWANYLGLNVVAIVSSDEKRQYTLQNGAKLAINYKTEKIEDEINKATNGYGVFALYDVIGKDIFKDSIKGLSFFGNYVLTGSLSGMPDINMGDLYTKSLSIRFPSIDTYKNLAFENVIGGVEFFRFAKEKNFMPKIHSVPVSKFDLAVQKMLDRNRTGLVVCSFE